MTIDSTPTSTPSSSTSSPTRSSASSAPAEPCPGSRAVHPDAGDATGEPMPVATPPGDATPPDEVLERLGAAFPRTDLVVRRPGDTDPRVVALFTAPEGSRVVDARPDGPRAGVPLSADAVRGRVADADAVAGVRAEREVLHG